MPVYCFLGKDPILYLEVNPELEYSYKFSS